MLEIFKAGGWLMWPILLSWLIALAIIVERFWSLKSDRVLPKTLVSDIWQMVKNHQVDDQKIKQIYEGSPLGRVLAIGLINRKHSREMMKESIEETGRHVAHELERFLNALGTVAAITPLMGLLGTVLGMIEVFAVITSSGVGDPGALASGISQALITTAAGISVAIPSMIFYRYFRGRVDALIIGMEQEAIKLVEVLQGEREA
ncbi:MAG: MotA/TolQ/ExbB proton channel family protein [Pseudomonadota bacterium]